MKGRRRNMETMEIELMENMGIAIGIMSKNIEYFNNPSIIEIQINNKNGEILSTSSFIKKDIPINAICLNLFIICQ